MKLTERQIEILEELKREKNEFCTPREVGGWDASWHSRALTQLSKKGLVERKRFRIGMCGGHWRYRITNDGHVELILRKLKAPI